MCACLVCRRVFFDFNAFCPPSRSALYLHYTCDPACICRTFLAFIAWKWLLPSKSAPEIASIFPFLFHFVVWCDLSSRLSTLDTIAKWQKAEEKLEKCAAKRWVLFMFKQNARPLTQVSLCQNFHSSPSRAQMPGKCEQISEFQWSAVKRFKKRRTKCVMVMRAPFIL